MGHRRPPAAASSQPDVKAPRALLNAAERSGARKPGGTSASAWGEPTVSSADLNGRRAAYWLGRAHSAGSRTAHRRKPCAHRLHASAGQSIHEERCRAWTTPSSMRRRLTAHLHRSARPAGLAGRRRWSHPPTDVPRGEGTRSKPRSASACEGGAASESTISLRARAGWSERLRDASEQLTSPIDHGRAHAHARTHAHTAQPTSV